MSDVYRIASLGMHDGQERLQAIGLNAASASRHGYRRHIAAGHTFDASMARAVTAAAVTSAFGDTNVSDAVRTANRLVDLRPGAVTVTGRSLDVAIDADDLFFALTDGQKTWLTRAGSFTVGGDGVLVGEGGLRVVGSAGDIRLPGRDVEIAGDGRIIYQGDVVATLQLFAASDPRLLRPGPGTLLEASAGIRPAEAGVARVRGGALEGSNTDAGREMVSLVALTRQFEGLTRVVQGYDEMLGRVIQKLGEN